jgi:hypothetical protein
MLTFKQGKFYNNLQQIVPLEHGNKEQIDILKRIEVLREGIWFDESNYFRCLCGHSSPIPKFKEGEIFNCQSCDQRFQFYCEYDDFDFQLECMKML